MADDPQGADGRHRSLHNSPLEATRPRILMIAGTGTGVKRVNNVGRNGPWAAHLGCGHSCATAPVSNTHRAFGLRAGLVPAARAYRPRITGAQCESDSSRSWSLARRRRVR